MEVSVLSNAKTPGCSPHLPGSVSDFEIIQRRKHRHKFHLEKQPGEQEMNEIDMHYEKYSNFGNLGE